MKKKLSLYICIIAALGLATACNKPAEKTVETSATDTTEATADTAATQTALTSIEFTEKEFEFGRIVSGEKVKHTFVFKNIGNAPLVIQHASASCGCTVPNWPKEPIAPGATGQIDVEFNSEGKQGPQHKVVTVTANTDPANNELVLKGEVLDASAKGPLRNP